MNATKTLSLSLAFAALAAAAAPAQSTSKVDPAFPAYKPTQGVSGAVKSVGSNTMNQLMLSWGQGFKSVYPNVTLEVESKGSGTAPTALIEGTATFGCMSRPMKKDELDKFEQKFGYKPAELETSIDVLAVYVHKDNPIASLTLPQIDAIFSSTRKGGLEKELKTWGELGLTGEWADKPISLYGRDSSSGTYDYFKEHALFKGDFKPTVKEQPGSAGVIQAVGADKYGVGYSGIGFQAPNVRVISVARDAKSKVVEPSRDTAYSGEYPMSRFLFVYLNVKPGAQPDPLQREFIRFVYSKDGQEQVDKQQFIPVTPAIAKRNLAKVGLTFEPAVVEAGAKK